MQNYSATYIFHTKRFVFADAWLVFSGALCRETYKHIVWKVSCVSY